MERHTERTQGYWWKLSVYIWQTLCCIAFYTVHRCFGKSDACIISLSCSYGNQDECVFVEDPYVCLVQMAVKWLYLPVWPFACVNSQRKDVNLRSLCRVLWLRHDGGSFHAHAHALFHWMLPFDDSLLIFLLSYWTFELYPTGWVGTGLVDIIVHDGCGYGADSSYLPFPCDVPSGLK